MRVFAAACFGLCWLLFGAYYLQSDRELVGGDITGSIEPLDQSTVVKGPSGLPLPRFVSLKSEKVNVRKGPSSDHPVAWVFKHKGLPVEITAEFENWRKIRDSEGAEGWILQQMLSGKRSAIVMSYDGNQSAPLLADRRDQSQALAQLSKGVSGFVGDCDGEWCSFLAGGYDGYVRQTKLWGVYPNELLN
jgi:SH3-like domain-containing protein